MFKFDPTPKFKAPVKVRTPGLQGPTDEEFTATFEALTIEEFNGFDLSTETGAREFLLKALQSADDVTDMQGLPINYNAAMRDAMINAVHVRGALISAYVRELGKAATGN